MARRTSRCANPIAIEGAVPSSTGADTDAGVTPFASCLRRSVSTDGRPVAQHGAQWRAVRRARRGFFSDARAWYQKGKRPLMQPVSGQAEFMSRMHSLATLAFGKRLSGDRELDIVAVTAPPV